MHELEYWRLKGQIQQAVAQIDDIKQQLSNVRNSCQQLSDAMREIRALDEQARRRQQIKRVS